MRSISKPNDDPKSVYLTCISRVRDDDLRNKLESVAEYVHLAAVDYDLKATSGVCYLINEHNNVGDVSKAEMQSVYTGRMVGIDAPGRHIYDKLMLSAPSGMCPLCAQRPVSSLDHYLPKTSFPSLVVVPTNLVPSCGDCNKVKSSDVPSNAETQTLHPYYDDVTSEQWLYAEVVQTIPASVIFFVNVSAVSDIILKAKVEHHFRVFKLAFLYASHAAAELAGIRVLLVNLFDRGGLVIVRDYLQDVALSRGVSHINSWQTAMYQAMAESVWFCGGGFRDT